MPLTLNVGLSKKVGLPNYGSLGVSCSVEVELDATLLLHNLDSFHDQVKQVYEACHQAVQDELLRQQDADSHNSPSQPSTNGNGQSPNGSCIHGSSRDQTRRSTANQIRAIEAIARRQDIDLVDLLRQRFGTDQAADLSIIEASNLIEELNSAANGAGGGR
jgi:hypothetical protein